MRVITVLLLLSVSLIVTGCRVPSTKVSINPSTGIVSVQSPKEIDLTNFTAELPNGGKVRIGAYHSHNSPDVISAQAAANAQMMDRMISLTKELEALAGQVGAKTATGGLAP